MIRYGAAASALLCATVLAGPVAGPAGAAPPPVTVTLRNGLRVVLAPDSAATALDVATWFGNGARSEPAGQTGMRHVVERLLLRGADGSPVRAIVNEGGTAGSATTPDLSCTWETVPAEALVAALQVEASRLSAAPVSATALEDARRAALADARGRAARSPLARAVLRLGAVAFEGTPYALPSEGDERTLSALTAKQVDAWRRDHVSPGSAVVTIVGRFDPQAAQAAARAVFESLPRGASAAGPAPALKPQAAERRATEMFDTPVRLVVAGWRAPGAADPDGPAAELLAFALGAGDDARLPRAMVKDWALAVAAQAGLDRRAEGSLVWTVTALNADADSSTAERVLQDLFAGLARDPLPEEEFAGLRARFLSGELFRLQTARARAQSIGEAAVVLHDAAAAARRLETLGRLTPADLQRVAARIFTDDSRTLLWLLPKEGNRP